MATDTSLARYWDTIGLKPGADLEKLDANYYLLVEKLPKDPTEEESARQVELAHAYAVLRRAIVAKDTRRTASRALPGVDRRRAVAATVLVLGVATLLVMNLADLRMAVIRYHPGDVLRIKGQAAVYGTVLGYDGAHRFHTGDDSPAYQIRRTGSEEVVWVGARVVEKGMEK